MYVLEFDDFFLRNILAAPKKNKGKGNMCYVYLYPLLLLNLSSYYSSCDLAAASQSYPRLTPQSTHRFWRMATTMMQHRIR